jgi:hypothetical protein
MKRYCGVISVGAVTGGGHVVTQEVNRTTGHVATTNAVPIAVELVNFRIGETFFRKIRVCQQFVSQFIHPGDDACIYVFKQFGFKDVIVAVRSKAFPSYSISFRRFLAMIFAQYFFGILITFLPAVLIFGRMSGTLALLAMLALPTYASWTLLQAWKEIRADFGAEAA